MPKASKEAAALGAAAGDDDAEDPEDLLHQSEKGFSTAYAKLVFAGVPEVDYAPHISAQPKEYFVEGMNALFAQHTGKVSTERAAGRRVGST